MTTPLLSAGHAAQLLDQVIADEVLACIQTGKLGALQERLAIELGRLEHISDTEMVDLARELIARALRQIAEGWGGHGNAEETALRLRYAKQLR